MSNAVRGTMAFAGLPVAAVTPFLWWWSVPLMWLAIVALAAWAVWLTLEYLRWARTLGRR